MSGETPENNAEKQNKREQERQAPISEIGLDAKTGTDRYGVEKQNTQDNHSAISKFRGTNGESFAGVYDGHGSNSDVLSGYVKRGLEGYLKKALDRGLDPEAALSKAYADTEKWIGQLTESGDLSPNAGSTASTVLIREGHAYVANLGDSTVYLVRDGKLLPLTEDHTVDNEEEVLGVKARGGVILNSRVNASLKITRAIGDRTLKNPDNPSQSAVSSTPDIKTVPLQQGDKLILASDGLWDALRSNPDEVQNLITGSSNPAEAAGRLVSAANDLWENRPGNYRDDITALVVDYQGSEIAVGDTQANGSEDNDENNSEESKSDDRRDRRRRQRNRSLLQKLLSFPDSSPTDRLVQTGENTAIQAEIESKRKKKEAAVGSRTRAINYLKDRFREYLASKDENEGSSLLELIRIMKEINEQRTVYGVYKALTDSRERSEERNKNLALRNRRDALVSMLALEGYQVSFDEVQTNVYLDKINAGDIKDISTSELVGVYLRPETSEEIKKAILDVITARGQIPSFDMEDGSGDILPLTMLLKELDELNQQLPTNPIEYRGVDEQQKERLKDQYKSLVEAVNASLAAGNTEEAIRLLSELNKFWENHGSKKTQDGQPVLNEDEWNTQRPDLENKIATLELATDIRSQIEEKFQEIEQDLASSNTEHTRKKLSELHKFWNDNKDAQDNEGNPVIVRDEFTARFNELRDRALKNQYEKLASAVLKSIDDGDAATAKSGLNTMEELWNKNKMITDSSGATVLDEEAWVTDKNDFERMIASLEKNEDAVAAEYDELVAEISNVISTGNKRDAIEKLNELLRLVKQNLGKLDNEGFGSHDRATVEAAVRSLRDGVMSMPETNTADMPSSSDIRVMRQHLEEMYKRFPNISKDDLTAEIDREIAEVESNASGYGDAGYIVELQQLKEEIANNWPDKNEVTAVSPEEQQAIDYLNRLTTAEREAFLRKISPQNS